MKGYKMEDDKILIQHKWIHGIYSLKDMIDFVKNGTLTKREFFEITRYNYDGIIKSHEFA